MLKFFIFIKTFLTNIQKHELLEMANSMTYKLILALFPLLIFIMSVLAYLELDTKYLLEWATDNLPTPAMSVINTFTTEVIDTKSPSLLSTSLAVAIFSASTGFEAIIKGINKSYNYKDNRNFLFIKILSLILTLLFTILLAFLSLSIVFTTGIKNLLLNIDVSLMLIESIFSVTNYAITLISIVIVVAFIYKFSLSKKTTLLSNIPGAIITVFLWAVSSKLFNIYVNNYSRYSKVYGTIGSVFILMLWLNLNSFFLLLGSEFNALIEEK